MWLNSNNINEYLKGISVVEVSGEGCANCISLMNVLDSIMKNYNDVNLYHIEVEEKTMDLVEKFEISAVPSILVFYNDKIMARCRGFQPEEILEIWLDSKISDIKKENGIA